MSTPEIVLITGAAGGLGKAVAREYHKRRTPEGKPAYKVYATDSRAEELKELQQESIPTAVLDVTDTESIKEVVEKILAEDGHIDFLICNAALHGAGFLAEIDYKTVEKVFDVNVHGTFRLVQAVVPYMMARRSGKVATMCDVNSWLARPFLGPYAGTKQALAMMTEGLCMELYTFGVGVSSIYPSGVQTDFYTNGVTDFARYESRSSFYHTVVDYFRGLLQKLATTGSTPQEAAKDIVDGLAKTPVPRFIYTGKDVWSLFRRGFVQQYISNSYFARLFIKQFGLYKLYQPTPASKGTPHSLRKEE